MKSAARGAIRGTVRLRLGEQQALLITSFRGTSQGPHSPAGVAPVPAPPAVPSPLLSGSLAYRPIIALIEVVPVAADDLAAAVIRVLEAAGQRCAAISLDGQNRLGAKLGAAHRPPTWLWRQNAPELTLWQGARAIVPGPAAEEEVSTAEYEAVLNRVSQEVDATCIDLGCRWTPRIFRAVLPLATHIWLVTRPGQWSGVEMRLEQAEYSGWTDMSRVRILQIGSGSIPALNLGVPIAGVMPDLAGERVCEFLVREVGRKP